MWIDTTTGLVARTFSDCRQMRPNWSAPALITEAMVEEIGFALITMTNPTFDPLTEEAFEAAPISVDGTWTQSWTVTALSAKQIEINQAAKDATEHIAAKDRRQKLVDGIKATTASGCVFDGDETSQNRMARAIIALNAAAPDTTVNWTLADNTVAQVGAAELTEALAIAGAAQAAIWVIV